MWMLVELPTFQRTIVPVSCSDIPHFRPENRGSMVLWNVSNTATSYMMWAAKSRIDINNGSPWSLMSVKTTDNNVQFIVFQIKYLNSKLHTLHAVASVLPVHKLFLVALKLLILRSSPATTDMLYKGSGFHSFWDWCCIANEFSESNLIWCSRHRPYL
jgi:hypothetical protein